MVASHRNLRVDIAATAPTSLHSGLEMEKRVFELDKEKRLDEACGFDFRLSSDDNKTLCKLDKLRELVLEHNGNLDSEREKELSDVKTNQFGRGREETPQLLYKRKLLREFDAFRAECTAHGSGKIGDFYFRAPSTARLCNLSKEDAAELLNALGEATSGDEAKGRLITRLALRLDRHRQTCLLRAYGVASLTALKTKWQQDQADSQEWIGQFAKAGDILITQGFRLNLFYQTQRLDLLEMHQVPQRQHVRSHYPGPGQERVPPHHDRHRRR